MGAAGYFIDTSALFKRYINETGTEKIDSLFNCTGLFIISSLTIIEFISNLRRLADVDRIIDNNTFNAIRNVFLNDIAAGLLKVEAVSSLNIVTAADLIGKSYVTTIDSIILATAINLKENNENLSFVCSDLKLCNLAENMGMYVLKI